MQNLKKEDYENYLGRKISREEFRHNRKELDREMSDKCAENIERNMAEDDDEEFTPEDLLSVLSEDDIRKMRSMTQEEIIAYEKKICEEIGVKYPG